jgi:hypothetical protein
MPGLLPITRSKELGSAPWDFTQSVVSDNATINLFR